MSNKIEHAWVSRASIGNQKETHAGLTPATLGFLERVVVLDWDKHAALCKLEGRLEEVLADVRKLKENVLEENVLEVLAGPVE